MGRISEFDFSKSGEEQREFKDEVTNLINFGKYATQVLTTTAPPSWSGREGEQVQGIVINGGTYAAYQYWWLNSAWRVQVFLGTT